MANIHRAFPKVLYARIGDPGTEDEYLIASEDHADLEDQRFEGPVTLKVARYVLAGTGEIHNVAPRYVEDTATA